MSAVASGLEVAVLMWLPVWRLTVADVERVCAAAASQALALAGGGDREANAEVSIVLTDDATIGDLNHAYRHVDAPTNVLAFPGCDSIRLDDGADDGGRAPRLLGDVVIAFETASAEAAAAGKTLTDHLSHLVVHGMLHLLGFDHGSEDDAEVMEGLEVSILASLGVADPYAEAGQRIET